MHIQGVLGIFAFLLIAWFLSEKRKSIKYSMIFNGVLVQFTIAAVLLYIPMFKRLFLLLNKVVLSLESASRAGTSFVFGYIGGGVTPFLTTDSGSSFILAFQALPLILVIGALSSLLFYWRILPTIVTAFSFVFQKTMRVGGVLGVGASTTVFLGMIAAPLAIKPYLKDVSRSEMFSLMTVGLVCVASTMMVLYATILAGVIPDALGHILTASFVHVAAAITISRIMVPNDGKEASGYHVPVRSATSAMDAVVKGTADGLHLLLNIVALLVVMVSLVYLANQIMAQLPRAGESPLTLQRILAFVMAPVVWLLGVPWSEAQTAGGLLGTKTILNELIAFVELAKLPPDALGLRTRIIMTYVLANFVNLGSIGMAIGAFGSLAADRRSEVVQLSMKALLAGTLATCMTGAVIGLLL